MRWHGVGMVALIAASLPATAGAGMQAGMVEFPGPRGPIAGFLARPADASPHPPIIMVHERWGLTPWIKENAGRVAAMGYVVLAVDLFGRRTTDDPAVADGFARMLDEGLAVDYLGRGARFLLAQPGIDASHKLGVIGWGLGGALAREFAQSSELVGPVVICYGPVTSDAAEVDRLIGKPILGIFGAQDSVVRVDEVNRFGELLSRRNTPFNLKIYPKPAHGFMRPGEPHYSPVDARSAWAAIEKHFSAYLTDTPPA